MRFCGIPFRACKLPGFHRFFRPPGSGEVRETGYRKITVEGQESSCINLIDLVRYEA
jgi:hypothetical protein